MSDQRKAKAPLDQTLYEQDPRACLASAELKSGVYVFVQDEDANVWVLPDGQHLHPKVLGFGRPAIYAGDLTIQDGMVLDLTNLSGTFQFDDEAGLVAVAQQLRLQGFEIAANAIRLFPADGSRPIILGDGG